MILKGEQPQRLLLDTCAIIYLFNGEPLTDDALAAIDSASVVVSPVSAWEIGLLSQKRSSSRPAPVFLPDPATWFQRVLASPSISTAPFDAEIAMSSCTLPEPLHRDPADRFLIATARRLVVPIVTRDRLILTYAALDHVNAIAC